MKHFMSVDQLTVEEVHSTLELAERYRQGNLPKNEQIFAANLFFEPSTRTKMSFVVAQRKLGLEVLDFDADTSSVQKGETLYDTARTLESIGANILVVRHSADDWYKEINANINIPIINAGSGKSEHPTQCMLDLLTIYQEFGRFDGLNIVITGDIKHSRVAHSNAIALDKLGANVYLSSAAGFEDTSLNFPYITMDEATDISDVMMLLRVQHERHHENRIMDNYLENYGLTKAREARMQEHAIIMHPAPVNRGVEIDSDLVECEKSRIFKQMNNGVYARMAIMTKLLESWGIIHENTSEKRKVFQYKRVSS